MADQTQTPQALIIGAGAGLSASFTRALARDGYALHLTAREWQSPIRLRRRNRNDSLRPKWLKPNRLKRRPAP